MKKVLAFVMAMVVTVSLFTACGESEPETGSVTQGDAAQVSEEESFDIAKYSPEELGDVLLGIFEKTESLHVSQIADLEASMMGSPAKIYLNLESDVSVADEIMHSVGQAKSNELTFDVEMYLEKNGENASFVKTLSFLVCFT